MPAKHKAGSIEDVPWPILIVIAAITLVPWLFREAGEIGAECIGELERRSKEGGIRRD